MKAVKQKVLAPNNRAFNEAMFCDGCGKSLGDHFIMVPINRFDISKSRSNGKLYCYTDGSSYAGSYHQRDFHHILD